jgi:hypothetical protein
MQLVEGREESQGRRSQRGNRKRELHGMGEGKPGVG